VIFILVKVEKLLTTVSTIDGNTGALSLKVIFQGFKSHTCLLLLASFYWTTLQLKLIKGILFKYSKPSRIQNVSALWALLIRLIPSSYAFDTKKGTTLVARNRIINQFEAYWAAKIFRSFLMLT
jgi:hypothetical protein